MKRRYVQAQECRDRLKPEWLLLFEELEPEILSRFIGVDMFRLNELFLMMVFRPETELGPFSISNLMGPLEARIAAFEAKLDGYFDLKPKEIAA